MRRAALMLMVLALAGIPAVASADTLGAGGLRLVKVGDFSSPVYTAHPPGDPSRVFVVEQGSGTTASIRVVHDGVIQPNPFLTLNNVAHLDGEQGLLSMAFAPDYATSGHFYVYYDDHGACDGNACDLRVDEYSRGADPDHAGPFVRTLFTVNHHDQQQDVGNHNGGTVTFGSDGLLYAGPGDGGTQGDPECDAQSGSSTDYLGKIVRFDTHAPGATPEIYARGLRNPFRFSFDRLTGDLLIGDVGGGAREEVDFLAAGAAPGANFGWPVFEGTIDGPTDCPTGPGFTPIGPVLDYDHSGGRIAITGGVVARDTSVTPLLGRYLYADYGVGEIRSAAVAASGASGDGFTGLQVDNLSSFTQDESCRVFVTSLSGPVYLLEAAAPAGPAACQASSAPPAPPLDVDRKAVDHVAPSLSRLGVTRSRFRVSSLPTPSLARTRTPTGTTFRFTLSEKAVVTLRFYRATKGRRSKGKCVHETRRLRKARKCTRYPLRGLITRRDMAAGRRSIKFTGRVGLRALPTGRYRAILRARDAAGNLSRGRAVSLRIVAR